MRHGWPIVILLLLTPLFVWGNQRSKNALDRSRGIGKLILMDSVANYSLHNEGRIAETERLLHEATVQNNNYYKTNAYFLLCQYYYSRIPDSLRYYLKLSEPLFIAQNRLEDLFRIKGWNIYSMVNEGKNDKVLKAVKQMMGQAKILHYPEGEEIAQQGLAFSYFSQNLIKEGQELYEEVLEKMKKRNAPLSKRVNILRQLLNNEEISIASHKYYLNELGLYISYCEKNKIRDLGNDISLNYMKYVYFRTVAIDASKENKMDIAYRNLIKIDALGGDTKGDEALAYVWMVYYKNNKQYEKGLQLSQEIIHKVSVQNKLKNYLKLISYQAEVYSLFGDYQRSCQLYDQYIALNDSTMSSQYYNDLAKLRNQHDMDKLALQNKQMELKSARDHSQMLVMEGGIILMLLACITFGYIAYARYKYGIQLKKAKEKAEEADRLKSAFLANMNHEIRTPLNAIVGFSQVLIDEDDKENREQYAKIIQNSNILLQRLISDVLDLSKIESNSMQLKYQSTELLPLMSEIHGATLLRMPPGVNLELNAEDNLTFYTDPNRLTQIITNLLNNAIKHTEKGSIQFGYHIQINEVCFFVKDTGEGIPEGKLDDIFSRFVQLKEMDKGVGLGLAICKGLVTQMGGSIQVESVLGKGSTFTAILPIISINGKTEIKEIKGI